MASGITRELVIADDVAETAADLFLQLAPKTIALAGGTTPRSMYERLAHSSFDWGDADVFFGDERCVPPDDQASNYGMARAALLSKVPARVHRMRGESCDAPAYEAELRSVFGTRVPRFDLVLLGLGEDGHTASLFPGDAALDERERWVVEVERPDRRRLTLTLPVLSAARSAMFLVVGTRKCEALGKLLSGVDIPAARVAAERVIVVTDSAALPREFKAADLPR
jgi:6-phosphogluconolactonase